MNEAIVRGHWNVPWLRDLPKNWPVASSRRLFSVRKELARPNDQQLAATQAFGVINQKEFERRVGRRVVQISQNLEKRRHVEKDDFVISMRSFEGGLERAWDTGCIRSSYVVLKPRAELDVGFFQYLFKSHDYIQALRATSNFIRDGQDLNISNFSLVDLPLPPLDDQGHIARVLDRHGARTAKLIRAKQRLIKLLEEQKQAIIHRAVTRGLDPNVRLKPSGIPWLGDVPEHWQIRRLKQIARLQSGEGITALDIHEQGEFPVFGGNGLRGYTTAYTHDGNYILIGRQGALCGNINYATGRFWASEHAVAVHPKAPHVIRWLGELLRVMNLNQYSISAAQPGLSVERIQRLAIPYPSLDEQEAIVRHMEDDTANIERGLTCVRDEVALLREFRTRLVADVVTGKLDVRAAAAALPEITESELIDEPIDGEDFEEALDDVENDQVAA